MIPALQALKIYNDANVTTVTTPDAITPVIVGGITDDLIDIIDPLLETELNRSFNGSSTVPSDLDGADGDVDFYADGSNTVVVYQKISGHWESKGSFIVANSALKVTAQFNASGNCDLSGFPIPEFAIYQFYNSGDYPIPVDYDESTKTARGGTPLENFTARFI